MTFLRVFARAGIVIADVRNRIVRSFSVADAVIASWIRFPAACRAFNALAVLRAAFPVVRTFGRKGLTAACIGAGVTHVGLFVLLAGAVRTGRNRLEAITVRGGFAFWRSAVGVNLALGDASHAAQRRACRAGVADRITANRTPVRI